MLRSYLSLKIGNCKQSLDFKIAQPNHRAWDSATAPKQPCEFERFGQVEQNTTRYATDQFGAEILTADTGILSGTCLKTPAGAIAIENLRVGDYVLTFDDGLQQIRSITRSWIRPNAATGGVSRKLVWIDNGTHGNALPLMVPYGQPIMIESDLAESVLGDPFAVVTADTLVGTGCSEYVSICDPIEVYKVKFDFPQLAYCAGGALVWFGGVEGTQESCLQSDRYAIFGGQFGHLLAKLKEYLPQKDSRSLLRNFYEAEAGAVSVDFVILTAAAASLGAVMFSILGPSGVDLAQRIGDFLASQPLTKY